MLSLKTIARRIRTRLHDTDGIAYDDDEIVDVINCGIRFIRRAIADIRPSLLATIRRGVLQAGEKNIALDVRPTKIIHVTAGHKIIKSETNYFSEKIYHNRKKIWHNYDPIFTEVVTNYYSEEGLRQTELAHVIKFKSDKNGTPKEFYLTGSQTINFFPIPDKETAYTILTVDDIEELTIEDKSPLNTEFDDFLVEYATVRLSIGNEYDVTQETQVMTNIYAQIQQILMPPPAGVVVKNYW